MFTGPTGDPLVAPATGPNVDPTNAFVWAIHRILTNAPEIKTNQNND